MKEIHYTDSAPKAADLLAGLGPLDPSPARLKVLPDEVHWEANHQIGTDAGELMVGSSRRDWLEGGNGHDTMFGGAGRDNLSGGNGDDFVNGGDGSDLLNGGNGNDTLAGDAGDDYLSGFNGDDLLFGGSGADYVAGGSGNDTLYGGAGNDTIHGGVGRDVLHGGAGADTFFLSNMRQSGNGSGQRDRIMDFEPGVDKIDVSAVDANGLADGKQPFRVQEGGGAVEFTAIGQEYIAANDTTVLTFNDGAKTMQLEVAGSHHFTANDFVL